MRWADLRMRLAALFMRRSMHQGLNEEMQFHIDMATEKYEGAGLPPEEARRRAVAEFGNLVRHRESARDAWGVTWLRDIVLDARFASRSLKKAKVFTVVTVLTLGLGLGATTGIFSVVNSIVLRPLPYQESNQLVSVAMTSPQTESASTSYPDFRDWQRFMTTLSEIGAHAERQAVFRFDDESHYIDGEAISVEVFPLLGVPPHLGRWFNEEEDDVGGPEAMVLEYDFWRTRYGADSSLIGRTVMVNGETRPVVGVMPAGFRFPDAATSFWTPLKDDLILRQVGITSLDSRGLGFLQIVGRAPDASEAEVSVELDALNDRISTENGLPDRGVRVQGLQEASVGRVKSMLFLFLGAVGFVLAIAAANVANLSLARASARQRETTVRSALGAGRSRLVRQFLVESVLLSGAGMLVGLPLALWLPEILAQLGGEAIPQGAEMGLDGVTLAFGLTLTLVTGLAFGLMPALRSASPDLADGLREATQRGGAGRAVRTMQGGLVVAEVALALVLMTGGGVLVTSFMKLTSVEAGFPTQNLLTARVTLSPDEYDTSDKVLGFFDGLQERIAAIPGVTQATTSYSPALAGSSFRQAIELERGDSAWAGTVIIGDKYFETTGVPVLEGRTFVRGDRGGEPIAIVNQTMARSMWPGQEAVGKRFRLADGISGSVESLDRQYFAESWHTVIGVAGDVRRSGLDVDTEPEFYVPHAQMPWPGTAVMVRTEGPPELLAAPVRRAVSALDPNLAVNGLTTMTQLTSRAVATPRFRMTLLISLALVATLLSVIGVYGVVAFLTSVRRREIGIRLALGAAPARVVRDVMASGMKMTLTGVGLGLVGALAVSQVLQSVVFGISPRDPLTYLGVTLLVVIMAALACAIPARRASRLDPQIVLRED